MARTTIDIASIIYRHLKLSVLMTDSGRPTGDLYLYQRPLNSDKEDVVVNTLASVRGEVFQTSIININIYVPNLSVKDDQGIKDRTQPDLARLSHLATLAEESLSDVEHYAGEYYFDIEQDLSPEPDGNDQHYIQFRIEFRALNN